MEKTEHLIIVVAPILLIFTVAMLFFRYSFPESTVEERFASVCTANGGTAVFDSERYQCIYKNGIAPSASSVKGAK